MSWFYPLQKLFGYEVSPEDDIAIEEVEKELPKAEEELFKRQKRTENMRYIPSWERIPLKLAERKSKQAADAFAKEQKRIMKGNMSMKDVDILISQQKDPDVREYQEKAIAEKRFQDAMFRVGLGPTGQSADSTIDSRMPRIKSIQKQEGITPNKLQALVVKEIDRFNQNQRVPTKSAHFKGAIPDPKRIMGDKYDPDKDYNWENTRGFVTLLDETAAQKEKKLTLHGRYARPARGAVKDRRFKQTDEEYDIPERIEWIEPVTRSNKMTIAHEQLHRFIHEHPAGKPFRNLQGNHELFVRAYTHLLDGGKLSDFELAMNLESASRNYKNVDLKRFIKKMPEYVDAFERAVAGGVDYGEQYMWEDSGLTEIIVTAPRYQTPTEKQMEQLLSTSKQDEYYPTFVKNLKDREGDHGNIPMPTNDEREKHLPKNERSLDVGYGHKIKQNELETGEIHGIKFKDSNGDYIPLTEKDKIFILEQDISFEINNALELGWNKKLNDRDLVWEELPTKYKYPLIDLAFNVGFEGAQSWNDVFDDVKNNDDKLFVKNLRRQNDGEWDNGLDNRVAKVAYAVGLVDSLKQAKEYGLKLADTNDIPLGKKDYTPVPSSFLQSILNK